MDLQEARRLLTQGQKIAENYGLTLLAQKISDVYRKKYQKDIIEIKRPLDNTKSTIPEPVKYSIKKIVQTGFSLKGDMILEIERTMDLCEGFSNGINE